MNYCLMLRIVASDAWKAAQIVRFQQEDLQICAGILMNISQQLLIFRVFASTTRLIRINAPFISSQFAIMPFYQSDTPPLPYTGFCAFPC